MFSRAILLLRLLRPLLASYRRQEPLLTNMASSRLRLKYRRATRLRRAPGAKVYGQAGRQCGDCAEPNRHGS